MLTDIYQPAESSKPESAIEAQHLLTGYEHDDEAAPASPASTVFRNTVDFRTHASFSTVNELWGAKAHDRSNMTRFYKLMGVNSTFDPTHRFETSWLLPSLVLFLIRAVISVYIFTTLFFILGWDGTHGDRQAAGRSFSYFTVLTYWGLAFYFLFAALHTFSFARTGRSFLNTWPRPLQALHSLYYTTVVTLPFLVTIVFWAVLYKGKWFPVVFTAWSNVSEHALNSVFAAFELFFPRASTPPPLHLLFLIIILALYLGLAYITLTAQGWYTYNFLDPKTGGSGRVAGFVFGILAAACVIYAVAYLLIFFRIWITERVLGMKGPVSRDDGLQGSNIELETGLRK